MAFLLNFYHLFLYQPLLNILVLFYQHLPGRDFGITVILLTLLIKIIFYPLGSQAAKSQKALQEIQPKIREIQEKYKTEKEKLSRAVLELYKKEKINPFSGCLPLLIQLPILIALYQIFGRGVQKDLTPYLYSFVSNPGQINYSFLGIIDLSHPSLLLATLTVISQLFQAKMVNPVTESQTKKNLDFSQLFQKQMLYFFPLFTFFILLKLPSALALYWLVTTTFSIGQQYLILKAKT